MIAKLKELKETTGSDLQTALKSVAQAVKSPIDEFKATYASVQAQVNKEYESVFPNHSIELLVSTTELTYDPSKALLDGSHIRIQEPFSDPNAAGESFKWDRQGTGSQRALFWSMLAVRSRIAAASKGGDAREKLQVKADEKVSRAQAKLDGAIDEKKRKAIEKELKKAQDELAELKLSSSGGTSDHAIQLPGHMLLIDEPETALHPNAVRAARGYLYELAKDPAWQVMLSTHSPLFIDPTEDHTTIVRLDRSGRNPTPRTFRSDSAAFGGTERQTLKMLLRFDSGLAEMFFGGFPLLVEGDTEFAAFEAVMADRADLFPAAKRPVVVRGRGKDAILLVQKILRQFRIPYAVLHDADRPWYAQNKSHTGWKANEALCAEAALGRAEVGRVNHAVSIPDFERHHGMKPADKEKPWKVWRRVHDDPAVKASVLAQLLLLLVSDGAQEPAQTNETIAVRVREWAAKNASDDPTYRVEKQT